MTLYDDFRSVCYEAAKQCATDRVPYEVLLALLFGAHNRKRPRELCKARAIVIRRMVPKGATEHMLGDWFEIHHTAVNCYKSRDRKQVTKAAECHDATPEPVGTDPCNVVNFAR